jgi:hypothetical protein
MIPKPGKMLQEANSNTLISLLPMMRKIFEKALLKSLHPTLEGNQILSDRKFGF